MNPRSAPANRPILGNTSGMSAHATPYHDASVGGILLDRRCRDPAAAIVGIARPAQLQHRKDRPVRARPRRRSRRRARRRRPRSDDCPRRDRCRRTLPVPAGCSVRPKSDSVNVVTCLEPEFHGRVVERLDRLTHLRQQAGLRARPDSGACRSRQADRRRSGGSARAPASSR